MKKSELKKKWYYRLWQVLTLLLLLTAFFIYVLFLTTTWNSLCTDYYNYSNDLGQWVRNDLACVFGHIKDFFIYLLIPLAAFIFSWLVWRAVIYIAFGKLEK